MNWKIFQEVAMDWIFVTVTPHWFCFKPTLAYWNDFSNKYGINIKLLTNFYNLFKREFIQIPNSQCSSAMLSDLVIGLCSNRIMSLDASNAFFEKFQNKFEYPYMVLIQYMYWYKHRNNHTHLSLCHWQNLNRSEDLTSQGHLSHSGL